MRGKRAVFKLALLNIFTDELFKNKCGKNKVVSVFGFFEDTKLGKKIFFSAIDNAGSRNINNKNIESRARNI